MGSVILTTIRRFLRSKRLVGKYNKIPGFRCADNFSGNNA